MKVKAAKDEVSIKRLDESSIPRIIAHKKMENKRKLDTNDSVKFVVLLDKNFGLKNVIVVVSDLRRVRQVDPTILLDGNLDSLCRKVESLLDVKQN